ncbi:MAG: hypothetical protein EBY21_03330 [Alphaproteobacteria bacterium]|nr:hypothetical protein [Alphaproteobacteria bacterium]
MNFAWLRVLACTFLLVATSAHHSRAQSESSNGPLKGLFSAPQLFNPTQACQGDCAFTLYGGRYLQTSIENVFAIKPYKPIGQWTYADSQLLAASVSRKLVANPDFWEIDAELGLGKRMGALTATEVWAALYFRWLAFPWSQWVKTSFAFSTGIDYASSKDPIETLRNTNGGRGANLLHFLSPEFTFTLPQQPDWDLILRFHHRSGGREFVLGPTIARTFFSNASGGAQYVTFGLRHHF